MRNPACFLFFLVVSTLNTFCQNTDSVEIERIYDFVLTDQVPMESLRKLTKDAGERIAGSPASLKAVDWGLQTMKAFGFDTVYTQKCIVKHWKRDVNEGGKLVSRKLGKHKLRLCALGTSTGTTKKGIRAGVIMVDSLSRLKALGKENIEGKIVFFNRPMDPTLLNPGWAYGGAADQRTRGASAAARYGAVGAIVRSLTLAMDDYPHTGVMHYDTSFPRIPAMAVSTKDADLIAQWLSVDPDLNIEIYSHCQNLPDVESYNVIGEIRGTETPEEIILLGGHLDSWDLCEGAHDDGAGCIHALEALRTFKELHISPRHTLRCVLFMDEEIAQRGGRQYAATAKANHEKHIVAIESDSGGFPTTGFSVDATEETLDKLKRFLKYFLPYGIRNIDKGGSGVDISFLRETGTALIGVRNESQRYFDYHHSANDAFEAVHERELQMGCASVGALIYLIDKYGL